MKLIRRHEVPAGGFRYTQPETKTVLFGASWDDLMNTVVAHRKANGLAVGLLIESEIEEQLCGVLPPGFCEHTDGSPVHASQRRGVTFQEVVNGTRTLVSWFAGGQKRVQEHEADRRADICAKCPMNRPMNGLEGCSGCNQGALHNLINAITGGRPTRHDEHIHACMVCGCSLKAKIQMPLDLLLKNTPETVMSQFPEHCWMLNS